MPCSYDTLYKELDELTQMLCGLCKRIEALYKRTEHNAIDGFDVENLILLDENLVNWWKEHKKLDREREEKKAKQAIEIKRVANSLRNLLQTLSPEEKKKWIEQVFGG